MEAASPAQPSVTPTPLHWASRSPDRPGFKMGKATPQLDGKVVPRMYQAETLLGSLPSTGHWIHYALHCHVTPDSSEGPGTRHLETADGVSEGLARLMEPAGEQFYCNSISPITVTSASSFISLHFM